MLKLTVEARSTECKVPTVPIYHFCLNTRRTRAHSGLYLHQLIHRGDIRSYLQLLSVDLRVKPAVLIKYMF